MEGPSLYLASQQLQAFCGQPIVGVTGNTKAGKERLQDQTVKDIFSWGKHLVFQFDDFGMRIHFMLFGTFAATVEGRSVTGDYDRASKVPRLALELPNGEIEMYNCSVKFIESADAKSTYDFSVDVLSDQWSTEAAVQKVLLQPNEEIADILLDQDIFAGVGNIIKNEVLFLTKTHPQKKVAELSEEKLREITDCARTFSFQFYEWRKIFKLKTNLKIYRKSTCPVSGDKVIRMKTGKRARWSFYCPTCQL